MGLAENKKYTEPKGKHENIKFGLGDVSLSNAIRDNTLG